MGVRDNLAGTGAKDLSQSRVALPENLVNVRCILQLKEGAGNWSTTAEVEEVKQKLDRAADNGDRWVELDCLIRRPTGEGALARCLVDASMPYILIECDDFIDPKQHRALELTDEERGRARRR